MPDADDFEERAAIMEFDGKLPRMWAESLARLATAEKPGAYEPERWAIIVEDAHRLVIGHHARMDMLGLTPADVRELLPMIKGRDVVSVDLGDVTVRMPGGGKARIYLRPRPGGAARWDEGRRSA